MNLHENKAAFIDAIRATSNAMNIQPHFVEKDYWLCHCLQKMVRMDAGGHAVFKGGTSLTKAYKIGNRFSEDLDIAIADAHLMSGNQLKTTIRRIAHGSDYSRRTCASCLILPTVRSRLLSRWKKACASLSQRQLHNFPLLAQNGRNIIIPAFFCQRNLHKS